MTCAKSFVEGNKMEFPEDVLTIISEYSKPIMRFSRRYKMCIQELNVARRMIGVKEIVKKRLCDKDANIVIDSFEEYVVALLTTHEARRLLKITPFGNDPMTLIKRNDLLVYLTRCVEIQRKKTIYMLDVLHKL
jgi:hypothetical protein